MDAEFSPNPEAPVLVIGSAGIDIVGRLKNDIRMGISNPAQIRSSFGGVARNVAENLARLGQPVTLLSAVGDDEAGTQLLDEISEVGVNVDHIFRSIEHPTGTYLAIVNTAGELQVALDDMHASSLLSPGYIRERADLFKESSAVFLDANLPRETLRTIISLGRNAGIPVCADPATAVLASKLRPYLKYLSMITPNNTEASVLTDHPVQPSRRREAIQTAKELVAEGVDIVVIALAQFGVCYATSETSGQISAIRTNVVDPTGAGDALTATILFGLLNHMDIDEAVRLGVSAASLTLGYSGAVVPDLSLEKLYDRLVV